MRQAFRFVVSKTQVILHYFKLLYFVPLTTVVHTVQMSLSPATSLHLINCCHLECDGWKNAWNKWRMHVFHTQLNLLSFNSINVRDTVLHNCDKRYPDMFIPKKGILCCEFIWLCFQKHINKPSLWYKLFLNWKLIFHVTHIKIIGIWHFCTQRDMLTGVSSFLVCFYKSVY